jgi:uncharacterized protein
MKSKSDLRFKKVSAVIVKVTNRCNLDCSYCYESVSPHGTDMSIEIYRNIVDSLFENTESNKVNIIFHGGEPTLISDDWYLNAIGYTNAKASVFGKTVSYGLQTNLLKLSDTKIHLFKALKVSLGVSLDGPAIIPSMRGKENLAFQNFLKAKANNLGVGILMTINQVNYKHFDEIMDWLETEANVNNFKANVVTSVGAGVNIPNMKAEQIFEAQHSMLEYMIETSGEKVVEENLCEEIMRFLGDEYFLQSAETSLCHSKTCGAGEKVVGITTEGNILPCGRFQWNDSVYFLGNISTSNTTIDNLDNFLFSVDKFQNLVPENWFDCSNCEAKSICSYGCQAFIARSKDKANVECLPTKMRFQYYIENRHRIEPLYEVLKSRLIPTKRTKKRELLVSISEFDNYSDVGKSNDADVTYVDYNDYKDYNDTKPKNSYDSYSDVGKPNEADVSYVDYNDYKDYNDVKR